jgi:hypothetical protein
LKARIAAILLAGLAMLPFNHSLARSEEPLSVFGEPVAAADSSTMANWSGYAASGQAGTFDGVKASWVQPSVKCPTLSSQYVLYWIGIDGYSSSTVEQIGTGAQCKNGAPVYFAWYEFYPDSSKRITTLSAKPGEYFSAVITASGSAFTMELKNDTTGETFNVQKDVPEAERSSAEWIAEAPLVGGDVQSLINFGGLSFTAASATSHGKSYPINSLVWDSKPLTILDELGQVLVEPSPLSSNGRTFRINWARR